MKHFIFFTRLSTYFFALVCFSSVGYASSPSDDVHFCRVLDAEDLGARDSIYAATKQALNLNVGEPRTVRMIYFLPNDRPFRQEVVDSMKVTIRQIQPLYADQMQAHGYGNKTFRFETDAQGEPMVHRVDGQHPNDHYHLRIDPLQAEIEQKFDLSANIYLLVIDSGKQLIFPGAIGANIRGSIGEKKHSYVLVPDRFHWKTVAHELGHAFGLEHDFRDAAYIMSYGSYRDRISACAAEFLAVHPYFNPDTPIEAGQSPSIERISPIAYPVGSTKLSVQLKISDSSGLHQVILFVRSLKVSYVGYGFEVKECRGLAGEKETVFEFEYDGVVPSGGVRSFSDFTQHLIIVRAVDTEGNVGVKSFNFWEITPHYIATLEGHREAVNSVSLSPDGTILASGSNDETVRLWDVATRTNIATLEGHTGWVRSVSFSPDGTILASGDNFVDNSITLWDVATRTNIATFGERDFIYSVSFSPDGTILASGFGNTTKLWDVATRTNIATLEGHREVVFSVSFSPDGTILASGSRDSTTKLWDVATRTNIATLEGHTGWVRSVSFSPDGTILASGSRREVKLWDIATRTNVVTLEGHNWINSIVFSPDGTTLASGSEYGTALLWDMSAYVTPVVTGVPVESPTADFDGDGVVGISDFLLFATQFGLSQGDAGYDARFDLDGDGTIGISDFLIFGNAFGK